jgi:hypothetical protein
MALSFLGECAEWHSLYSEFARNGTIFTRSTRRTALSLLGIMRVMALSLLEVGVCAEWHCLRLE